MWNYKFYFKEYVVNESTSVIMAYLKASYNINIKAIQALHIKAYKGII
jgi:hypothetical protein